MLAQPCEAAYSLKTLVYGRVRWQAEESIHATGIPLQQCQCLAVEQQVDGQTDAGPGLQAFRVNPRVIHTVLDVSGIEPYKVGVAQSRVATEEVGIERMP